MPHLKFRGMLVEELQAISTDMITKLVDITGVPRDHFTLELVASTFVHDGFLDKNRYPFVNVDWFDRGEEAMAKTAEVITAAIKQYDYEDVGIYFTNLIKSHYYENNAHF